MKNNLEDQECQCLVEYLELKNIKYSKLSQETPAGKQINGVWSPNWNTLRKNKILGVKKGVPDYLICLPKILLFLEMKKKKGGVVSEEQKEWIKILNSYVNVEAVVANGFDEAKLIIDKYYCLRLL